MNRKVEQFISILCYALTMGFALIPVLCHRDMTKFRSKTLKKASYKEIKEKMLSVDWQFDPKWPQSLFDKNEYGRNHFHASIFRFDHVGYHLTLYGYIRASILQRKIAKSLKYDSVTFLNNRL